VGTTVDLLEQLRDKFNVFRDLTSGEIEGEYPDRHMAISLLASYYGRIYDEAQAGKQLAWVNYAVPSELCWAMDITPVEIDAVCGAAAATPEDVMPYIDVAERHIPDYICAVNKIFLGAMATGAIPVSDMIIVPSHPCDSNLATYPVIAERYGFPYFCIDAPYLRDERGLRHVKGELGRLMDFLEEQTGRKLDYGRFREVMEYSNRTHECVLQLTELAQAVPSPFGALDLLTDYPLILGLCGTPELVEYLEKKLEAVRDRVKRLEGRPKENIRLVWIYGAPVFDYSLFTHIEAEYGAYSVGNMNNNFIMKPVEDLSSIDSILAGLAAKTINLPMGRECGGPWENYVTAMIDLCRRYRADAAVFAGHVACKANWPIMKLVRDKIYDELEIPTLIFELDLMDPRITSMETIKSQFDAFLSVHFPAASSAN
jgi:benzoyl-CoA reductase/2-hydroxyglutaryl-CoA dehydratase subunit BcrC/BadD/HgdB